jgi:hypothetical protein
MSARSHDVEARSSSSYSANSLLVRMASSCDLSPELLRARAVFSHGVLQ